jgi:hypothetical protein
VLVAQHLLKLGAHLATSLARLHVNNRAPKNAWRRGARGRKRAGRSGETQETPCDILARETGNAGGARACIQGKRIK